jgi:DNA repair protein RadA
VGRLTKLELERIEGVGKSTAKRLRAAGFPNVETVAVTTARELKERANYDKLAPAVRIVEAARRALGTRFMTAWEHLQMTRSRLKCTTGSRALDELLGGGIETHAITELVGEYGAGKTQLCLNLCVRAQLKPEEGGLGGGVLFFDTEGTFSSERIYQIASHNGFNPDELLHNITISRVYTSDHQMFLLDHAFKLCAEENIKLVVVDSAISQFRGEYLGREALSERQQRLNLYLHKLLRLAEIYGIAVVITNQAQAEPVVSYAPKPVQGRPAGGNIMAHASNTRVWLKRSKGSIRIARVFDSPWLPEGECPFRITEKGIEDVEEEEKKVAKNTVEAEASR